MNLTPRQWELIVSIAKHAGLVGVVAFVVALGQGLSGIDPAEFGSLVGPVLVPAVIVALSTLAKSLQKGIELKLHQADPPKDDGPAAMPIEDDHRNDEFQDPFLPFDPYDRDVG